MSKVSEIREICGDYAFDVEYSEDNKFTMFFNSRRNSETVKRCIEVDDSVPNAATAVDFVEVVRCKNCVYCRAYTDGKLYCHKKADIFVPIVKADDYCSYGERSDDA